MPKSIYEADRLWLGAMPVKSFLEKYLSVTKETLDEIPNLPEDPFDSVPQTGIDSGHYDNFIKAIAIYMPDLMAVNTSDVCVQMSPETENDLKSTADISVYNRVQGTASTVGTDVWNMELWMEFKTNEHGEAFHDPCNEEERLAFKKSGSFTPETELGLDARYQLTNFAGAHHAAQFRHFTFSVVLQGAQARFLRWDPSSTIVTAAFDYHEEPRLMAEFCWRFNHLSAEQRGHDVSVQPADLVHELDAHVRKELKINRSDVLLYRYEMPGMLSGKGYLFGPLRPPVLTQSLIIRRTRTSPVVWIPNEDARRHTEPKSSSERNKDPNPPAHQEKETLWRWSKERIVYMKDTWRLLSDVETMAEHEIYEVLYNHRTPNIPEDATGGDVNGGMTQTVEPEAEWLCALEERVFHYQHYRLLIEVVGRPLYEFKSSKQLVTVVYNALEAHSHAFDSAKILHCDIDPWNIILTLDGKGLLINWEMARFVDECGNAHPECSGMWPFMSANLLLKPGGPHKLADDLESFLHVLAWMMLQYIPADENKYDDDDRSYDMLKFNEAFHLDLDTRGIRKADSLGSSSYPSRCFQPRRQTPLWSLIRELASTFRPLYMGIRPADYDESMARLSSAAWFMDIVKHALEKDPSKWPADDGIDPKLLEIPGDNSELSCQQEIKSSQQDGVERSIGLPSISSV